MKRYHIKTGFREKDIENLEKFTEVLNNISYKWTIHSLDNMKYRILDIEKLLYFIKDYKLQYNDIFEYYINDFEYIDHVCYRIKYTETIDIIIILDEDKTLITIYINLLDDKHETLKKELYNKS